MMTEYEQFCRECEGKTRPEVYRRGFIFLSQRLDYLNNHYVGTLELNQRVADIGEDKISIAAVIHQEPPDLLVARKKSLKALQGAYQHIHALNDLMEQIKRGTDYPRQARHITSIGNTLMWSSSLSVPEYKYLDAKRFRQSNLRLTEVRDYKSPRRMAYSFIFAVITEFLSQKSAELTRAKQIEKKLIKPKSLSTSTIGSPRSPLEAVGSLPKRVTTLRRKVEAEVDDLKLYRDVVFDQSLKLFFNEWKIQSWSEEKPIQVTSFMTRKPLAARMQRRGSEHAERLSEAEEEGDRLDELEEMVPSFLSS